MTLKALNQYGKGFQLKVLGSLLTDKTFLQNVRDVLLEEYFDSDAHKWIINQITAYFDKYHTTVSMDVLKVELKKEGNDILQVALKEELRNSYEASQEDLEYVQEEFQTFCKNQEMKQAILNSTDLLQAGDFDGIRNTIEKAMKAGMDKNIGHEYIKILRRVIDLITVLPSLLLGLFLTMLFKGDLDLGIWVLYLVILVVVSRGLWLLLLLMLLSLVIRSIFTLWSSGKITLVKDLTAILQGTVLMKLTTTGKKSKNT